MSFRAKFKEVKDLQDSKEILARQPDSREKLKETKDQIDEGREVLKDFISKMERAIELIKEKNPNFDTLDLEDSKEKCDKMLEIVEKKEEAAFTDVSKQRKRGNKYGLSREEQLVLDNWEDQMKEIVGLQGRSAGAGV
jgi:hypothetical protein